MGESNATGLPESPDGRPAALRDGRTFLGWETRGPILGRSFSKVVLMGPYWSGTNAVREEVLWRFYAPVLNPDKLEVCAPTQEALESLANGLSNGTLVRESFSVGKRRVPQGYKLLGGPVNSSVLGRLAKSRLHRSDTRETAAEEETAAAPAHPEQSDTLAELIRTLTPPVTLCFTPDTEGHCELWKHTVRARRQGPIPVDQDTLVIIVTKDPLFWLKSMSKHFYEMKVVDKGAHRRGLDSLFCSIEHEGRQYDDAVQLWTACMESYLDDELFPNSQCVILRYEDFLFRFWDVMVHLAAFLPANCQRLKESPTSLRSKTHGREVRGREDALMFYSHEHHRVCDFTAAHRARLDELPPALLGLLGYTGVLVNTSDTCAQDVPQPLVKCGWVPSLREGDIVAARIPREGGNEKSGGCAGRFWATVTFSEEEADDGLVDVKLLQDVPRQWLVAIPEDWSAITWPVERGSTRGRQVPPLQQLPRELVDLRLPCPSYPSISDLPLTEEGYRDAVAFRSTKKMSEFITRVITNLEVNGSRCGRVLDKGKLLGFARWFSGEAGVQSLARIRYELPGKEAEHWVTFALPRPSRPLPGAEHAENLNAIAVSS